MTSRRLLPALGLLLLLGLLVWWLLPPASEPTAALVATPEAVDTRREKNPSAQLSRARVEAVYEAPAALVAELNSPRSTITGDLNLINDLFTNWRINFPRVGHPFGENSEITAALIGDNPLRLPLMPRDHPAINAAGELTDRWGTPFRFHALASDRMEVRSAGPDKIFGTPDDAVLTPPGVNPPL
ncbi:MAG: hypothetical protein WCQ44_00590 [Opitutaceae bacterium]|jgi:hypothetical protein